MADSRKTTPLLEYQDAEVSARYLAGILAGLLYCPEAPAGLSVFSGSGPLIRAFKCAMEFVAMSRGEAPLPYPEVESQGLYRQRLLSKTMRQLQASLREAPNALEAAHMLFDDEELQSQLWFIAVCLRASKRIYI